MRYSGGGLNINLNPKGFLLDTNVLLEILLEQAKGELARAVLVELSSSYPLYISDFSLHSVGIKLWNSQKNSISQNEMAKAWESFLKNVEQNFPILTLDFRGLQSVGKIIKTYGLDFDDAYQSAVAMEFGLDIISEDSDFNVFKTHNPPPVRVYTLGEMASHLGIP